MVTPQRMHEIYILILNTYDEGYGCMGICRAICMLWEFDEITDVEKYAIEKDLEYHKPTKDINQEFFYDLSFNGSVSAYWWRMSLPIQRNSKFHIPNMTERSIKQRVLFLKKMMFMSYPSLFVKNTYKMMLQNLIKYDGLTLCSALEKLFLDGEIKEYVYEQVKSDLFSNRPTESLHPEFFFHYTYEKNPESTGWWKDDQYYCNSKENLALFEQRKSFLEKLIKITDETQGS